MSGSVIIVINAGILNDGSKISWIFIGILFDTAYFNNSFFTRKSIGKADFPNIFLRVNSNN